LNEDFDKGKLVGVVSAWSKEYGKSKGFIARITSETICVYSGPNAKYTFKFAFLNINTVKMILLDEKYLYCLQESSSKKFML